MLSGDKVGAIFSCETLEGLLQSRAVSYRLRSVAFRKITAVQDIEAYHCRPEINIRRPIIAIF